MSIVVEQLLGETAQGVRAAVRHEDSRFEAEVVGPRERLVELVGMSAGCEFTFEAVESWRVLERDVPDAHGLFPTSTGAIKVIGRVSSLIEITPASAVVDVYVRAGPEFLAFDSTELGGATPPVGTALEVCVTGLSCFPTWT